MSESMLGSTKTFAPDILQGRMCPVPESQCNAFRINSLLSLHAAAELKPVAIGQLADCNCSSWDRHGLSQP